MLLTVFDSEFENVIKARKNFAIGHGWFSSTGGARPSGVGTTQYSQAGMVKQKSQMQMQHWFNKFESVSVVTSSYYGPKADP